MSGMPSPYDSRDGIDGSPSRGIAIAVVTLAACALLAMAVLHMLPFDVGGDVTNIARGDANARVTAGNGDASAGSSTTPNGTDTNGAGAREAKATDEADDGGDSMDGAEASNGSVGTDASSSSGSGRVVRGNGWSVTLPGSWVGRTVISYSDNGNRATVRVAGMGNGVGGDDGTSTTGTTPYLLLIERVSGREPEIAGDVGNQLAYSVPSSDGTWHLEVWTVNAVWLVRQDDVEPYQGTRPQVWDTMCDLLTGGEIEDAEQARALGTSDGRIGTGEIDYLTDTLKPETQVS